MPYRSSIDQRSPSNPPFTYDNPNIASKYQHVKIFHVSKDDQTAHGAAWEHPLQQQELASKEARDDHKKTEFEALWSILSIAWHILMSLVMVVVTVYLLILVPEASTTITTISTTTVTTTTSSTTQTTSTTTTTSTKTTTTTKTTSTTTTTQMNQTNSSVPIQRPYICSGVSPYNLWTIYGSVGIAMLINTSDCGFDVIPSYFTSLAGTSLHFNAIGYNAIYVPTESSFRAYIQPIDGYSVVALVADSILYEWSINWYGIVE